MSTVSLPTTSPPDDLRPKPGDWNLRPGISKRWFLLAALVALLLAFSARRTELDRAAVMTAEGAVHIAGIGQEDGVSRGWRLFWSAALPLVLAEKTEVSRIDGFDPAHLPPNSYLISEPVREYDVATGKYVEAGVRQYLIEPLGYLTRVCLLMLKTIEMGLWGTLLAVLIAAPLGVLGARGYSPHPVVYTAARGMCSFSRSMPELIIAMFFVLLYGFGPIAGVLALGIHSFGFLGKFFADDIENADAGPQEALRSTGAGGLKVLRMSVLPQVLPQYVAYVQYILERNVRSASVLGIVGAGGIGMELKGRWDMSNFGHVTTILLVVFATVLTLEFLTQRIRKRLM
ncbi:phosphonate ABC transporter, permease protein PhnE [Humisphaera borealis]|uniref:Phosphonate ABC transporter, permease protein PhnE n=1 Tax=Humisphaera borealis TaxID=2807512 RepID=A0A7M2WUL6_9BACT|nr:phosphonate ABC transporter, permease protein PhnE [Humisphaera borealis]QOV89217.1 phosphonate ABC transporter, permease protein PhnE [Humisphaera borealis]